MRVLRGGSDVPIESADGVSLHVLSTDRDKCLSSANEHVKEKGDVATCYNDSLIDLFDMKRDFRLRIRHKDVQDIVDLDLPTWDEMKEVYGNGEPMEAETNCC